MEIALREKFVDLGEELVNRLNVGADQARLGHEDKPLRRICWIKSYSTP